MSDTQTPSIPWFGARKLARSLATEVQQLRVPAHVDHRFRRKPITDSGGSRSPIPVDADQRSFA